MRICEQLHILSFGKVLVDILVVRICKPYRWRYPKERKPVRSGQLAEEAGEEVNYNT